MVQNEFWVAEGPVDDPLEHKREALVEIHVCHVDIPLDVLQVFARVEPLFGVHSDLDDVALADVFLVRSDLNL